MGLNEWLYIGVVFLIVELSGLIVYKFENKL